MRGNRKSTDWRFHALAQIPEAIYILHHGHRGSDLIPFLGDQLSVSASWAQHQHQVQRFGNLQRHFASGMQPHSSLQNGF
jgi:hypothetical protein